MSESSPRIAIRLLLGASIVAASIAHADVNDPRGAPVFVVSADAPEATRAVIAGLQARGVARIEVARGDELPTEEELVRPARLAYGKMDFARALRALQSAERSLIDGRRASAIRAARLAGLEAFWGACLLLQRDRAGAAERFALARALDPRVRADAMFPPEVSEALASARSEPSLPIALEIAPPDSRLWIDEEPSAGRDRLSAGLHYIVVERADRRPAAALVRISASSTHVALSAVAPADATEAITAFADPKIPDTERIAVSALVGAPVWRVTAQDGAVVVTRFSARDIVRQVRSYSAPEVEAGALEHTFCTIEPCEPVGSIRRVPLRRRAWFWGAIGGGAAIVLGGIIAGAVLATSPRNFNAVVR
jgi:hypothetical protein